jgi:hypothetical protein
MALRVLSAGNIIIIGSLLLILALQVRIDRKEIFELPIDRCGCRLDKNGHVGKKPTLLLNWDERKGSSCCRKERTMNSLGQRTPATTIKLQNFILLTFTKYQTF